MLRTGSGDCPQEFLACFIKAIACFVRNYPIEESFRLDPLVLFFGPSGNHPSIEALFVLACEWCFK
jgi:hypothetical protein